jgi:hypothetical protein
MAKSRNMRWAGHAARMEKINSNKTFIGKPEGKTQLGRPGGGMEDNIKRDLKETENVDWINVAQYRDRWRTL